MKLSARKAVGWSLFTAAVALVIWGAIMPRNVMRDTPMMRTINRLHQICGTLRFYADEHDALTAGSPSFESLDTLVAARVLGPEDAAFLRTNGFQFHGFDPHRIGEDIAVFETVFTNTRVPRRIIG